jgi:hypothetical protein
MVAAIPATAYPCTFLVVNNTAPPAGRTLQAAAKSGTLAHCFPGLVLCRIQRAMMHGAYLYLLHREQSWRLFCALMRRSRLCIFP